MLRHPESVGRRNGDRVGGDGFSGAGDHQRGRCFARGLPDSPTALGVDAVLGNIAEIVDAVDLPVDADSPAMPTIWRGWRSTLALVAGSPDYPSRTPLLVPDAPLYPLAEAVERVRAARSAIDESGADVLLTARAECFLLGHPEPLREAIRRLQAFAEAGAEVVYTPGVRTRGDIRVVGRRAESVPAERVDGIRHRADGERPCGAWRSANQRRIRSVTGHMGCVPSAARQLAEAGSFAGLAGAASFGELNGLFG